MKKLLLTLMLSVAFAIAFASTVSANYQYIVKSGDTLWKIAKNHNVSFNEILAHNKHLKNPNLIYIGDKITIPQTNTQTPNTEQTLKTEAQQVLDLVNQERTKQGLGKLTLSIKLNEIATEKSKDMALRKYFAHNSPTFGTPFEMLKKFGVSYKTAGENIAAGQKTPQAVMEAWMNSPGHRANILNANYKQLGVGMYKGGQYGIYWTQLFTN